MVNPNVISRGPCIDLLDRQMDRHPIIDVAGNHVVDQVIAHHTIDELAEPKPCPSLNNSVLMERFHL